MRLLVIEDTSSSSAVQISRSIPKDTVYSLDWHTISVVIDIMQKWLPLIILLFIFKRASLASFRITNYLDF